MIEVTIKMAVPPEKRVEILQTLQALLGPIRHEQGCASCNFVVGVNDKNIIFFKEEWLTSEDWGTHQKSGHHSILIGAMTLLRNEPEISVINIASSEEALLVHTAKVS